LCNVAQAKTTMLAHQVADVVLEKVLEPVSAENGSKPVAKKVFADVLQKYVGVYKSNKDEYQRVEFKDGKLWLSDYGIELIPQSNTVFRTEATDGTIEFGEKLMTLNLLGEKTDKYSLVATNEPKDLRPYVGDYYSAELDATWQLQLQDGKLSVRVKHSPNPATPLRPISDETFLLEGGSLRFPAAGAGPNRALLTVSRIRNVEFVRVK